MRDEQRPSTTGGAPDRRSRSVADMQELINGLREEQQQAKQALHACQQGMCKARGAIMIMLWNGTEREEEIDKREFPLFEIACKQPSMSSISSRRGLP